MTKSTKKLSILAFCLGVCALSLGARADLSCPAGEILRVNCTGIDNPDDYARALDFVDAVIVCELRNSSVWQGQLAHLIYRNAQTQMASAPLDTQLSLPTDGDTSPPMTTNTFPATDGDVKFYLNEGMTPNVKAFWPDGASGARSMACTDY